MALDGQSIDVSPLPRKALCPTVSTSPRLVIVASDVAASKQKLGTEVAFGGHAMDVRAAISRKADSPTLTTFFMPVMAVILHLMNALAGISVTSSGTWNVPPKMKLAHVHPSGLSGMAQLLGQSMEGGGGECGSDGSGGDGGGGDGGGDGGGGDGGGEGGDGGAVP